MAESLRIGCLSLLEKPRLLSTLVSFRKITTIYIAPASNIDTYKREIAEFKSNNPFIEFHHFAGGFKMNSLILFSLKTKEDLLFFNKITRYTIGKNGEIIEIAH